MFEVLIALKFVRHLSSTVAETHEKCQSYMSIVGPNLIGSEFCEILNQDVLSATDMARTQ